VFIQMSSNMEDQTGWSWIESEILLDKSLSGG